MTTKNDPEAIFAHRPEVYVLAAAPFHTNDSAEDALTYFGFDSKFYESMRAWGMLIDGAREWRVEPVLRTRSLQDFSENYPDFYRKVQEYYLAFSDPDQAGDVGLVFPAYLQSLLGAAYHLAELGDESGLRSYSRIAEIDSAELSLAALTLASEQADREVFSRDEIEFLFLQGMTYYRMKQYSLAMSLLRRVAQADAETSEVAIARHLVGRRLSERPNKRQRLEGHRLLESSHELGEKLADPVHRSHVKHSLAISMRSIGGYPTETIVSLLEESLDLCKFNDDSRGISMVERTLAEIKSDQGDFAAAQELLEDSLKRTRRLGNKKYALLIEGELSRVRKGLKIRRRRSAIAESRQAPAKRAARRRRHTGRRT